MLYPVALKIEAPEVKDLLRLAMPLAGHPYPAQQQLYHHYKKLPYLDREIHLYLNQGKKDKLLMDEQQTRLCGMTAQLAIAQEPHLRVARVLSSILSFSYKRKD